MGSKTIWVSEEPGRGSALKLVCNAFVGTLTAAIGQSVGLATQLGLDPQLFLDALDGGASDSPYVHVKGAMMLEGDYPASFALDGVRKDLGLIRAAEQRSGTPTTLTEAVLACFDAAAEQGHGADDMAAVVTAFRRGLTAARTPARERYASGSAVGGGEDGGLLVQVLRLGVRRRGARGAGGRPAARRSRRPARRRRPRTGRPG